jgi:hypothetical protein
MTVAPHTTAPAADGPSHHQDVLNDLIDLGNELARLVVDQAKANTLQAADAAIAFDRVARSVRRCIALARKLAEPPQTADRTAVRKRIIRAVEDTIQRHAEASEAETLHQELLERLDAPELEDEIGDRPVDEIIADIVRDLGLAALPGTHPWKRRTPEDIALLCTRAKQQVPRVERNPVLSQGPGAAVPKVPIACLQAVGMAPEGGPVAFANPPPARAAPPCGSSANAHCRR